MACCRYTIAEMSSSLDLPTFIARWQRSTLTERSATQQHFLDLCVVPGRAHAGGHRPGSILDILIG